MMQKDLPRKKKNHCFGRKASPLGGGGGGGGRVRAKKKKELAWKTIFT